MFARIKGRVHYNIRSMFLSTKNKSVMLQIITLEEKQKYHITSRSSKLSRKQRFLAAFILLREKESKLLCLQEEQKGDYIIILSMNNKSVMLQIFTL